MQLKSVLDWQQYVEIANSFYASESITDPGCAALQISQVVLFVGYTTPLILYTQQIQKYKHDKEDK